MSGREAGKLFNIFKKMIREETHAEMRMTQRAGMSPEVVKRLEIKANKLNLPKGEYYSVINDEDGNHKGYAAYKKVGKPGRQKVVMTTVYSPRMGRPRGQMIKVGYDIDSVKSLEDFFNKHKRNVYGMHERVLIDKKNMPLDVAKKIGFKKSYISIPEPGQLRQLSYRGPKGFHFHDHKEGWVMHKDLIDPLGSSAVDKAKHVLHEGVPSIGQYINWVRESKPNIGKLLQDAQDGSSKKRRDFIESTKRLRSSASNVGKAIKSESKRLLRNDEKAK